MNIHHIDLQAIRAHANKHYNAGWHWIVEAWSDTEIMEYALEYKCKSTNELIAELQAYVDLMREREAEINAAASW